MKAEAIVLRGPTGYLYIHEENLYVHMASVSIDQRGTVTAVVSRLTHPDADVVEGFLRTQREKRDSAT